MQLRNLSGALHSAAATSSQQETFGKTLFVFQFEPSLPLTHAGDIITYSDHKPKKNKKLDDGWPESEKDVFQAALRMVVVKDSR